MPTLKRLFPLPLLLVLLLAGCDSSDSVDDDRAYLGTWYNADRDQYLVISDEAITAYAVGSGECYGTFTFEIAEHDGGSLVLEDGDVIEVSVNDEGLTLVEDDGDVLNLVSTELDPEVDLDLC